VAGHLGLGRPALLGSLSLTVTIIPRTDTREYPIWAAAGIEFLQGTIAQIGLIVRREVARGE
jgi:hypothetical protein